jgi:hypothetical protein
MLALKAHASQREAFHLAALRSMVPMRQFEIRRRCAFGENHTVYAESFLEQLRPVGVR